PLPDPLPSVEGLRDLRPLARRLSAGRAGRRAGAVASDVPAALAGTAGARGCVPGRPKRGIIGVPRHHRGGREDGVRADAVVAQRARVAMSRHAAFLALLMRTLACCWGPWSTVVG